MEKTDKHKYEYDAPIASMIPIIKQTQCPLFPERIQGSLQCQNCTYNRISSNPKGESIAYKCLRQYYGSAHYLKTKKMLKIINGN